ncbi:Transient receptor potential-gamma protein, partial [Frankliniella fusca]
MYRYESRLLKGLNVLKSRCMCIFTVKHSVPVLPALRRTKSRLGLGALGGSGSGSGSGPGPHKRRWGTLIEAARSGRVGRLISRSRSEDSVCNGSRGAGAGLHRGRGHPQHRSNSEEATDTDSAEGLGLGLGHPLASALAALKRKRHKFSTSRGSHAVQTTSHNEGDDVAMHGLGGSLQGPSTSQQEHAASAASKKALQRASSVPAPPARTPEDVLVLVPEARARPRPRQQQLQEAEARVIEHLQQLHHQHQHLQAPLTPCAAEESGSRDTLLLSEAAGGSG